MLRGAARTLCEHRPLIALEHGAGSGDYEGGPRSLHALLSEAGYGTTGLDGDGPYDAEAFASVFAAGERVNFLARPLSG